ncbi:MAG: hypothetical protein JWO00_115 [Candidatus Parcubacteria bacterium]|nr:hypothetical protein [Candidatus Parcubacteria bacterium]
MLSLFPSLLTYRQAGPFIIRVLLGITLAYFGYLKVMKRGTSSGSNSVRYGILEIFISVFLVIGLYTQLAAMLNALILLIKLVFKAKEKALFSDGINYYVLLLVMAISLIFTGAGMFAFDLAI